MSILQRQQRAGSLAGHESVLTTDGRLLGRRGLASNPQVSTEQALRNSVMWACLRLRADLISSMPVRAVRDVGGVKVDIPTPVVLVNPGGDAVDITEHMYSSQFDLDRCGNSIGIITERDGGFRPKRIDLVQYEGVTVQKKDGKVRYRIERKWYEPEDVWHEKQFTVAGLPVGLSPISYAALTLGNYLSAASFAQDWFDNGSVPSGRLRNKAKKILAGEARSIKERFREAVRDRDLFVHGNDWEYEQISVAANESQFLETIKATGPDVCRFYGVPGDMVDVETSTGSVTYANVTQRNLQLLIVNIGPAVHRREVALSKLLAAPRSVELETNAILRMDPASLATMLNGQVAGKTLAPSEARLELGRAPFTPEQLQEMKDLGIVTKGGDSVPTAGKPENGATS